MHDSWLYSKFNHICYCCSETADAYFELVSMLCELALWYMKHSSKLASGERFGVVLKSSMAVLTIYLMLPC